MFGQPNITGGGIIRNFNDTSPTNYGVAVGFDSYYGALKASIRPYNAIPVINPTAVRVGDAGLAFDASSSNTIYKSSATVQPSSLVFNYTIKR